MKSAMRGAISALLDRRSDDELAAIVAAAIEQTGATGVQQMGQVMKAASPVVAGRADGGRVAAVVKAALAAR